MLRSMTGFGRALLEEDNWTQIWEIRSVNGKYLDTRWKLPALARTLEQKFEKLVKQCAARGRVEISLFLQMKEQPGLGTLNHAAANAMLGAVEDFAGSRGDEYIPDYNRLLGIGFLWDDGPSETEEILEKSLERGLALALEDWNESRAQEARGLEKDILTRLLHMEEWVARIRENAPQIKEDRFATVRDRLSEILERLGQELDESRFLQEIVLMADKLDVSEELTRLALHFDRLRELLSIGEGAGRKLDFTMQECFREITTCGNKIQDANISRLVVDIKNELEKCREQVQNLE